MLLLLNRCTQRFATHALIMMGLAGLPALTWHQPAYAGLFDDDEARKAILELRTKLDAFTRETNDRINVINGRIDRLEQASRGQLELTNQIEQLRSETAKLRGQLEVQANDLAELQRKQRDQMAQVSDKLKQFDPVPVSVEGKSVGVDPAEKRNYDTAIGLFQAGDFKAAQTALNNFVQSFPQSALRSAAEYWSASAIFAQRDWRGAIAALQGFVTRNPDSQRVPEALLLIGNSQLENRERLPARKTFEQLIEKYPSTPAAAQARDKLATIPTR